MIFFNSKKYVLAVSGGPDSMAMLNMFKKKVQAVCTVNYKKRKDSDNDVRIVKEFCNKNNIKFYLYEVSEQTYKENKMDNFQSLARKIRYDFFYEICHKENNLNLMIAHNINDYFETAYMQFAKKSKSLFYGIQDKTKYKDLKIYRPLLRFKKATLQRYCDENNIEYAIDYTNALDIYERNRVRKIINGWSNEQLLEFKKKILKYNRNHKKDNREVTKKFEQWKENNFSLLWLSNKTNKKKELIYYLLYNFLKLHGEKNNNENKINNIIVFLEKKNNKRFRLENDRFLVKENNTLLIQ